MSDIELIDRIAHEWIACGGDAEGVEYMWMDLRDKVKELENE